MELKGTSAVVTGAASGLGAAVCATLADRGVRVLGLDLDLAGSIEHARELRAGSSGSLASGASSAEASVGDVSSGDAAGAAAGAAAGRGRVTLVAADVTSAEEVSAALATLDSAYPLRLAVNCAGIAPASRILGRNGPHDLDLFRRVIDVNLVGTFNVLRLVAEVMAGQNPVADPAVGATAGDVGKDETTGQRGVIINTASIAAYEGQIGQVAYAASKGAVVSMTLAAARDLARHGIRVNTIAPGVVATPMLEGLDREVSEALAAAVPFPRRLARPEEFARLVTMIAEHDYLNGETIRMDGALRMGPR